MVKINSKLNISHPGIYLKADNDRLFIFIAEDLSNEAISSLSSSHTQIGIAEIERFPFIVIKTDKFVIDAPMLFKMNGNNLKKCSIIMVNPKSGKIKNIMKEGIISDIVCSDIVSSSNQRRKNFPSLDMSKIHILRIYNEYSSEQMVEFVKHFCRIL